MTDTISISKFKATCLEVLKLVQQSGKPITVTRRGVPVAQVIPPPRLAQNWLGCMAGEARVTGDLLEPLEVDWEVLQ